MLAAAVLWFIADASFDRLAVSPPGVQNGVATHAGLQITRAFSRDLALALTADAGGTYVDGWKPAFEASGGVLWRDAIELRAGARHDDRLSREGVLADFRDPTGRLFVGVAALPFRKGHVAAGATFDYERAMPGAGRLPSGTRVTAVVRFRVRG